MRQKTLSMLEYPTETAVKVHLQEFLLKINGPQAYRTQNVPTMGLLIDRFMADQRIEEILRQKPGEVTITNGLAYSTAMGYRSYLRKHICPRWAAVPLVDIKALAVDDWMKSLQLAPKTKASMRALMHQMFEKAMLWELIDPQRNPIDLVKVKGGSKRRRRPQVLSPEQFQKLLSSLEEPYKTMAIVAMCTGLRVSEILALRWEHIDFKAGVMQVQKGTVHGRIGKLKTEASEDDVPLDSAFADVLNNWRGERTQELVFPSGTTGRCYHASTIQQKHLRPNGEKIGVARLGWHTFRHTYRSLLDETGAPVGVQQKLMRHSNISTTMNTYGNSTLRAKQQANTKVVEMVLKAQKPLLEAV